MTSGWPPSAAPEKPVGSNEHGADRPVVRRQQQAPGLDGPCQRSADKTSVSRSARIAARMDRYAADPLHRTSSIAALRYVVPRRSGAPSGSPGTRPCGQLLRFDGSAPHPSRSRNVISSRMAGARRAADRRASLRLSGWRAFGAEQGDLYAPFCPAEAAPRSLMGADVTAHRVRQARYVWTV